MCHRLSQLAVHYIISVKYMETLSIKNGYKTTILMIVLSQTSFVMTIITAVVAAVMRE